MITAADALILISVPGVFDTPQQLQQFSADDIFSADPVPAAETMMGVDGILTGGFVFAPTTWRVMLMADSPSKSFFDAWIRANKQSRTAFPAFGVTTLTSLGEKYNMTRGILTTYPKLPDAARILRPLSYTVTWQDIDPATV